MPTVQNTTQEQPGLAQTLKMETFIALANHLKLLQALHLRC